MKSHRLLVLVQITVFMAAFSVHTAADILVFRQFITNDLKLPLISYVSYGTLSMLATCMVPSERQIWRKQTLKEEV